MSTRLLLQNFLITTPLTSLNFQVNNGFKFIVFEIINIDYKIKLMIFKDPAAEHLVREAHKSLPVEELASRNYQTIKEILKHLNALCITETATGKKPRKHEQRLLRNMSAHAVVLDLLQIPYEKVGWTH